MNLRDSETEEYYNIELNTYHNAEEKKSIESSQSTQTSLTLKNLDLYSERLNDHGEQLVELKKEPREQRNNSNIHSSVAPAPQPPSILSEESIPTNDTSSATFF